MLVLLSDGAGLTGRQCATVLARAGHSVEALSPAGLCLGRMTRHVRRVHRVPAIGRDPFGWLDAALEVAARRRAAARSRKGRDGRASGPTSSCWRCSAQPSTADGVMSRASSGTP